MIIKHETIEDGGVMTNRIFTVALWTGYGTFIFAGMETHSYFFVPMILFTGFWAGLRTLRPAA